MISIQNKENCCGCSACQQVCPKHCINMQEDNEGFLYPIVDESACIDCGLCETICPELHPYAKREPMQVLAAINKDEEVRMHSSSGGIFHILASKVITEGGVVFGARFDEQWQVVIDYAETMDGIKAFMGSKYVQARVENAYKDAKRFLTEGRKVLFAGTPCQIAALRHYLRKDYDNLLTVDFICHGIPSPKVWRMYLNEVIREGQRISSIEFRNKKKGWKRFCFNLYYNEEDNTISLLSHAGENHYMKAFLQNVILRPSCYDCQAKSGRSYSDLTIADFWGIQRVHREMDDDKGTSMVFINTSHGKEFFNVLSPQLRICVTECAKVRSFNPAFWYSATLHPKRIEFFDRLDTCTSLIDLINVVTQQTFRQRLYVQVGHAKHLYKFFSKLIKMGG